MNNLIYVSIGMIGGFILGIIAHWGYVRCKYHEVINYAKTLAAKKKEHDDWKLK
jgi:hypothetical protein